MPQFEGKGFRAPWLNRTKDLWEVLSDMGFLYDSSYPDTDVHTPAYANTGVSSALPYHPRGLPILEIPLTLPQDWELLSWMKLPFDEAVALWRKKIEYTKQCEGMAVLLAHPRDYRDARRLEALRLFVLENASVSEVWLTSLGEFARFWIEREYET